MWPDVRLKLDKMTMQNIGILPLAQAKVSSIFTQGTETKTMLRNIENKEKLITEKGFVFERSVISIGRHNKLVKR